MTSFLLLLGDISLTFTRIYRLLLLIYFLMSWVPGAYQSGIGRFLTSVCEPFVGIFRQFIPPIGMISIAGMVAYLFTYLFDAGLVAIINFLIRLSFV